MALLAALDLRPRERRTAKALLRVERRSLVAVKQVIRRSTDIVAVNPSASAIRRQAPALQASVAVELLSSRREARTEGRQRLEDEFEETFAASLEAHEKDAAGAFVAAAGLAAAWGSASLLAVAAGSSIGKVPQAVAPSVDRTVATEVARAFNEEREAVLSALGEFHSNDNDDTSNSARRPGLYKVYSAILDGKTCSRCFAADGEVIELHKSFESGTPPLHPRCRCIVEHIIVEKPKRLEDIRIDYELFKQELRDIIREGRIESDRHALGFASDSLGSRRSPLALSRRFDEERYATVRSTASGSTSGGGKPPPAPPRPPRQPPPPPGGGSGSGGDGGERKPLTFVPALTPKHVAELGADTHGDVFNASKAIFAGNCPDVQSWMRLWEPPAGYSFKFTFFGADHGVLRVAGKLYSPAGDELAELDRSFRRHGNEIVAKHDYFVLPKAHQGKGVGEAVTRSAILGYRDIGVARIDVEAHMVGRYAWARFGFSWEPNSPSAEMWRKKLESFLVKEQIPKVEAAAASRSALTGAFDVAKLEIGGRHLGKDFLLSDEVHHWNGGLRLVDGDIGYAHAKERLKL